MGLYEEIRTKIREGTRITASGESLVIEILRRIQGDMAELKLSQQDIRHQLTLIESRLAGMLRPGPQGGKALAHPAADDHRPFAEGVFTTKGTKKSLFEYFS